MSDDEDCLPETLDAKPAASSSAAAATRKGSATRISRRNDNNNDDDKDDDDSPPSSSSSSKKKTKKKSSASSSSSSTAATAAAAASMLLHGTDIQQVLASTGPIVTCVVLRHLRRDGKDGKPHPASPQADNRHKRAVLMEDIDEVELDTTPSRGAVRALLGGPITFLGQYPTEGIVVVARQELPSDLPHLPVHALRDLCRDWDIDATKMLEKSELVDALRATQLPWNPHILQPPLDGIRVRGDVLLLRVAETDEALDNNEDNDDDPEGEDAADDNDKKKELKVLSNEEFFLPYTKEEYIAFASRTDVVAESPVDGDDEGEQEVDDEEDDDEEDDDEEDGSDEEEEEEEEDDEDDDDDEDYKLEEDEVEEKRAVLNLVMGEILRKFRKENGRGPDTRELLELRSEVAAQLDVEVATVEALEESNRKRKAGEDDNESKSSKKVKFVTPDGDDKHDDNASDTGGDEKIPAEDEASASGVPTADNANAE